MFLTPGTVVIPTIHLPSDESKIRVGMGLGSHLVQSRFDAGNLEQKLP